MHAALSAHSRMRRSGNAWKLDSTDSTTVTINKTVWAASFFHAISRLPESGMGQPPSPVQLQHLPCCSAPYRPRPHSNNANDLSMSR